MVTVKYNKDISIDISEKNIAVYENKERKFTAENYTVNKILINVEIEKEFADITYHSKLKDIMVCKRIKSCTDLLKVDKIHLLKKVMEAIKNDLKVEME